MANALLKSKPITRAKLAEFLPNHEAVKLIENLLADVTSFEAFPVGSLFTSVVATDPAQLLGYGTWAQYAAGQVLVGVAPGDPDFGTAGGTGGAKTSAISPHAGAAVADHPDHTHGDTSNVTAATTNVAAGTVPVVSGITNNPVATTGASVPLTHNVTQPNSHADVSVMQPYITVYFWHRTA